VDNATTQEASESKQANREAKDQRRAERRGERENGAHRERADRVVKAHKERARKHINPASANQVVDKMKKVVAEKRQAAAAG